MYKSLNIRGELRAKRNYGSLIPLALPHKMLAFTKMQKFYDYEKSVCNIIPTFGKSFVGHRYCVLLDL